MNEGVETVYVPLELLPSVEVEKYRERTRFAAVLPRVWRTADEEGLREQLRTAKERGVECAVLGNLGHFALVRGLDMELRGDFGLNVFNSAALQFLKEQGLSGATLSFELRHEQLRDISKCIPCEAIVYGRLPLMITENCIVANEFGCRHFKGRCGAVCADSACARSAGADRPRGRAVPGAARLRLPERAPERQDAVAGRQARSTGKSV